MHLFKFAAYCEEDRTFYDETGWYVWPRTKSGDTAQVYCKHGTLSTFTIGFAERSCGVNFDGTTYWEPADTSECKPVSAFFSLYYSLLDFIEK